MNLLSQFQQIFSENPKGYASITGVKPDGTLIATTQTGAVVLLQGKADIGKAVFYDRVDNKVVDDAPDVVFREFGV